MSTIRLTDDHHTVRQGLRTTIEGEPWSATVVEVADVLELVARVERVEPTNLVVDRVMTGTGDSESTRLDLLARSNRLPSKTPYPRSGGKFRPPGGRLM